MAGIAPSKSSMHRLKEGALYHMLNHARQYTSVNMDWSSFLRNHMRECGFHFGCFDISILHRIAVFVRFPPSRKGTCNFMASLVFCLWDTRFQTLDIVLQTSTFDNKTSLGCIDRHRSFGPFMRYQLAVHGTRRPFVSRTRSSFGHATCDASGGLWRVWRYVFVRLQRLFVKVPCFDQSHKLSTPLICKYKNIL